MLREKEGERRMDTSCQVILVELCLEGNGEAGCMNEKVGEKGV